MVGERDGGRWKKENEWEKKYSREISTGVSEVTI